MIYKAAANIIQYIICPAHNMCRMHGNYLTVLDMYASIISKVTAATSSVVCSVMVYVWWRREFNQHTLMDVLIV